MRRVLRRRLLIAALGAIGLVFLLVRKSHLSGLDGVATGFEVLFLFAISCIAWALRAPVWLRAIAILLVAALAAPVSVYLGGIAFAKVSLDIGSITQDFVFRLCEVVLFLGATLVVDLVSSYVGRMVSGSKSGIG